MITPQKALKLLILLRVHNGVMKSLNNNTAYEPQRCCNSTKCSLKVSETVGFEVDGAGADPYTFHRLPPNFVTN
jgi:hypothetical protein